MAIPPRIRQVSHSVWQYLNQSVFDPKAKSVWHPKRFWRLYKIRLLERSWQKDSTSKSQNHPGNQT